MRKIKRASGFTEKKNHSYWRQEFIAHGRVSDIKEHADKLFGKDAPTKILELQTANSVEKVEKQVLAKFRPCGVSISTPVLVNPEK